MVHKKKIQLEKYIKFLNKEADNLSLKAEETQNLKLNATVAGKVQKTSKQRLNSLKHKLPKKRVLMSTRFKNKSN